MNWCDNRPLKLSVQAGPRLLRAVTVRPGRSLLVGRGEHCGLRMTFSRISKDHFLIVSRDADWFVRDLGSRNGTILNNARVEGEMPLGVGDKIQAGDVSFEISFVTMLDRLAHWMLPMTALNPVGLWIDQTEPIADSWIFSDTRA